MITELAIQSARDALLALDYLRVAGVTPEDTFDAILYGAASMPTESAILAARDALKTMVSLQTAGNFPEIVELALLSLIAEAGGGGSGEYIATTEKGVAGGVATLDPATGRIPFAQLSTEVLGAMVPQGAWNPSTNTPTLTSGVGTKGYYYVCSTGGTTQLDGVGGADDPWGTADVAMFSGTVWQRIDARDAVRSVNGYLGAVVLTFADVGAEQAFTTLSDTKLGDRTAVDTTAPTSLGPGTLTAWLGWIANRIKAITGATDWFSAPATTLATTATHIANTSNPHAVTSAQIFSASQTANQFFGAPNGSAGTPTFRALVAADIPLATNTLRGAISREVAGTFTPVLEGGTTAGTQTYSSQVGSYYLVGKICCASIFILLTAKGGTMAGLVQITGLPFTPAAFFQSVAIAQYTGVTFDAGNTQLTARVETSNGKILLFQCGSGVGATVIQSTQITSSFLVVLTATYVIA